MEHTTLLSLRLAERWREADDVDAFSFISADGTDLPPFEAGAHIDLVLANGITRQYSLCNDPTESARYLLGVLREEPSRGGSVALHDEVAVGDVLQAATPRNLFPLARGARRSVLLAGGIGITPLLCMAQVLARTGEVFELHYASRSAQRCAFLSRLRKPDLAPHVRLCHDDGPPAQRFDAARVLDAPQPGDHLYVCGPAGFITHVQDAAHAAGWRADCIHSESFTPVDPTAADANTAFEIVLAESDRILHVPADRTVIDVLTEHGLAPPVSCTQGICGTCVTTVLEGQIDHRDAYLSEADRARGDCFTPCCSRAKGARLVLDL